MATVAVVAPAHKQDSSSHGASKFATKAFHIPLTSSHKRLLEEQAIEGLLLGDAVDDSFVEEQLRDHAPHHSSDEPTAKKRKLLSLKNTSLKSTHPDTTDPDSLESLFPSEQDIQISSIRNNKYAKELEIWRALENTAREATQAQLICFEAGVDEEEERRHLESYDIEKRGDKFIMKVLIYDNPAEVHVHPRQLDLLLELRRCTAKAVRLEIQKLGCEGELTFMGAFVHALDYITVRRKQEELKTEFDKIKLDKDHVQIAALADDM